MSKYIFVRILWILPSLLIVSLIAFFISKAIPGDPVLTYMQPDQMAVSKNSYWDTDRMYRQTAHQIGADLPSFYWSLHSRSLPDTLYRIMPQEERRNFKTLAYQTGSWEPVAVYRKNILEILVECRTISMLQDSLVDQKLIQSISNEAEYLFLISKYQEIDIRMKKILEKVAHAPERLGNHIRDLSLSFENVKKSKAGFRNYLPSLAWHGWDNQYHIWLRKAMSGDFGKSIRDQKPAIQKIGKAMKWTLIINFIALFFAFLVGLPIGVWAAKHRGSIKERRVQKALFFLFAIPSFWLATILVATLTTDQYGAWLDWFPTEGLGAYRNADSIFGQWLIITHHLILPIFCLVSGAVAYIARQMRQSMVTEMGRPYTLFYKSFGLGEKKVIWRQAFRNALFPMITILGAAIPAVFSGSLIIEVIFNIPGMGRLMYSSIRGFDWNVVFAVLLFISSITVVSYLLTDLMYQYLDPRLRNRFNSKSMTK